MKFALIVLAVLLPLAVHAEPPQIAIPEKDIALIKSADLVEVSGTNERGTQQDFTIKNWKALKQFADLLTSPRYVAVPKDMKPEWHTKSYYKVRFSSHGTETLEIQIIADSIINLPDDTSYYVQGAGHTDILMAPLLKLR